MKNGSRGVPANVTTIPLGPFSMVFKHSPSTEYYPGDRIQKGLVIALQDTELVEEGIGFGVPLFKIGHETIFPGYAHIIEEKPGKLTVNYHLNLVQRMRLSNEKMVNFTLLYKGQEWFSKLHRKIPPLRGLISQSSRILKRIVGLETTYEEIETVGTVAVTYSFNSRKNNILVSADLSALPNNKDMQIILANEQGASYFDVYHDSSGLVRTGKTIGSWQEVLANQASFIDFHHGITFSLAKLAGAKLFRGRELVRGCLAWAGLDYALFTHANNFNYTIQIDKHGEA